jgi:hypothetical protein
MKKKITAVLGVAIMCFLLTVTAGAALKDNGDGTITDTSQNLVWLKDANCFGPVFWDNAKSKTASLQSGTCGLSDKSTAGQWRLPTKSELLVRSSDLAGFRSVNYSYYWTSSDSGDNAWTVYINSGSTYNLPKHSYLYFWPVRKVN